MKASHSNGGNAATAVVADLRDLNAELKPQALKLKTVAKLLGVSKKTVARLVLRGKLRRLPHLRHIIITMASIDELLKE